MNNKKTWGIVAAVVAVIAIAVYLFSGGKKETKVSFTTAKVEKTNIQTTITATGTIEPVTSVTVGTQVSGIVAKLYVDYNSVVKKGQVIAELDKTNLTSELNTAQGQPVQRTEHAELRAGQLQPLQDALRQGTGERRRV